MGALFDVLFIALLPFWLLISPARAEHKVGEPQLESLPIWSECCSDRDCVPQNVEMLHKEKDGRIAVGIDGVRTEVSKEKFSPVPSPHTWVCYLNPNAGVQNENIRCILYPQGSGTTDAIELLHSKTADQPAPGHAR